MRQRIELRLKPDVGNQHMATLPHKPCNAIRGGQLYINPRRYDGVLGLSVGGGEMTTVIDIINGVAERHEERMKNDPKYAMTVAWMQESTRTVERTKHYDRDGYCDSPYRGY